MKTIVTATLLIASFSISAYADWDSDSSRRHCHEVQPAKYTCFARDARGQNMGVSSSFSNAHLAAGRAIASCQRKSPIPDTCAITRCKAPKVECHD